MHRGKVIRVHAECLWVVSLRCMLMNVNGFNEMFGLTAALILF